MQITLINTIKNGLSGLRDFHSRQRSEVMKILEEETSHMKSVSVEIKEKLNQIQMNKELKCEALDRGQQGTDAECRDVHITTDVDSDVLAQVFFPNIWYFPSKKMALSHTDMIV